MSRPPIRTEEGMLGSILRRLTLVERRVTKTPAGLPARLGPEGQEVTNWNDAVLPGFYWSAAAATNAPPSTTVITGTVGVSFASGQPVVFQEVRRGADPYQATSYRRYRSTAGVWTPWRLDGRGRGPTTLRTATTPQYWDFWDDTTDGLTYVGNKSGGWRLFSGQVALANRAWDLSSPPVYARSDSATIPTVLETNEYLQVTPIALGTGYATMGVVALIRNPTNSTLSTRLMQFAAATTQNYVYQWQIATY
ncbi:minor tail protein [Microbacterium phage Metamorphoo]|uniref:Minor tail protein n=1 Tax=Microbacterium phage Metamorphoo TaxID=2201437 RepID=A0A2Z4Q5V1_9CAUD|nr:minor tail protein [Microbacterium phage Metamorphoo]AWY05391.1 minor tail protein [Microbacterium phage Metamorphoo]